MVAKTRPKYNEFLKEFSNEHKITSFFGSDKPAFLRAWNKVKIGGINNIRPTVSAAVPGFAVPEPETPTRETFIKRAFKETAELQKKVSKRAKAENAVKRREMRNFINPSTKFSVKYTPEDYIKDQVPLSEQLARRKKSMGVFLD